MSRWWLGSCINLICLSSQDSPASTTPVWGRRRAWRCCISSAESCIKSCQETQNHSGYQSNVSLSGSAAAYGNQVTALPQHACVDAFNVTSSILTSFFLFSLSSSQDWCRYIEICLHCWTENGDTFRYNMDRSLLLRNHVCSCLSLYSFKFAEWS